MRTIARLAIKHTNQPNNLAGKIMVGGVGAGACADAG